MEIGKKKRNASLREECSRKMEKQHEHSEVGTLSEMEASKFEEEWVRKVEGDEAKEVTLYRFL